MRTAHLLALFLALPASALPASAAFALPAAPLTIEVTNVRNDRGHVLVSVCPKERFLADGCVLEASMAAHAGTTTLTLPAVPAGTYAVQAFHDENDSRSVDQALFGIPREGVGFSRDAPIRMRPPRWEDARFTHGDQPQTIRLALRYMLGPSGPAEWRARHPDR